VSAFNGNGAGPGFDGIVVGGGHNALTAAAYLQRAGLRTCVLEARDILGGACVTEEVSWPPAATTRRCASSRTAGLGGDGCRRPSEPICDDSPSPAPGMG
jgi:glycine/D-amino acid oxidase-like deaminating enzyme